MSHFDCNVFVPHRGVKRGFGKTLHTSYEHDNLKNERGTPFILLCGSSKKDPYQQFCCHVKIQDG